MYTQTYMHISSTHVLILCAFSKDFLREKLTIELDVTEHITLIRESLMNLLPQLRNQMKLNFP